MMSKQNYRTTQSLLLMLTLFVLGLTFYFQYIKGLQPCPLCFMQRLFAFLFAITCLIGLSLKTLSRARLLGTIQMVVAAGGLFFATRQIWLQSLPPEQAPACIPGLDVLMRYFPWTDVLHALLWGTGDCAEIAWTWLGMSMPTWAAFYFLFLFFTTGLIFFAIGKSLAQLNHTQK